MPIVEIRSYNLKPRMVDRFHAIATEQVIPLLRRAGMDVIAHGPSLHDDNSYVLIRRFNGLRDRENRENSFYSGPEWQNGPRDAILGCIENYTTVVVDLDGTAVESMRKISAQLAKQL